MDRLRTTEYRGKVAMRFSPYGRAPRCVGGLLDLPQGSLRRNSTSTTARTNSISRSWKIPLCTSRRSAKEKKLAYASVNRAVCAIRFLFDAVLGHKTLALEIPMAKVPKRLPQILSREEVSRLFAASASLRGRTVLMTTYAAGLRVSEVCALQVADIESAPDRMCLKVRQGKGAQDRYTPKEGPLWGSAALAPAALALNFAQC